MSSNQASTSQVVLAVEHGGTNPKVDVIDGGGASRLPSGPMPLDLPQFERTREGIASPTKLPAATIEALREQVAPLLSEHRPSALGYSFAGPVTADGIVKSAPNIWGPQVRSVPYARMLRDALGMPVAMGNDMWAAANDIMAHGLAAGLPDVRTFCVITVSSGVGSKVVLDGRVHLGVSGVAGEIGHMPILLPTEAIPGHRCGCGAPSCVEAGASGNANAYRARYYAKAFRDEHRYTRSRELMEQVTAIGLNPGPHLSRNIMEINALICDAARRGDQFALDVVSSTLRPLARAVACVEAEFNVRNYYFIGGFALALGEGLLLPVLRQHLAEMTGSTYEDLANLGRVYRVEEQTWGLRGVAAAAHSLLSPQ